MEHYAMWGFPSTEKNHPQDQKWKFPRGQAELKRRGGFPPLEENPADNRTCPPLPQGATSNSEDGGEADGPDGIVNTARTELQI